MCLPGSGNSVAGEPGDEQIFMRRLEYARDNTRIECDFCNDRKPEYQVDRVNTDGGHICEECRQTMTIDKLVRHVKKSTSSAEEDIEYLTDLIREVWPQTISPTVPQVVENHVKTKKK
jgi:hypothetical protein